MSSPQRSLFDTEPEPWEADDAGEQLVASVVLASGPPKEFDYSVPEKSLRKGGTRAGPECCSCRWGKGNRPVVCYCCSASETRAAGPRPLCRSAR